MACGVEDRVEAFAGEYPIGVEALATVERVVAVAVEVVGFGDAGESFSLVGTEDDVAEIRARLREVDGFAEVDSGVAGDVFEAGGSDGSMADLAPNRGNTTDMQAHAFTAHSLCTQRRCSGSSTSS